MAVKPFIKSHTDGIGVNNEPKLKLTNTVTVNSDCKLMYKKTATGIVSVRW